MAMRALSLLGFVIFAVAMTGPAPALADGTGGFRCGTGRVVRDGETEDDVARKCGDPDAVRSWTEMRSEAFFENGRRFERQIIIAFDEWKYDLGRNRLIRYVTFEQGLMVRVRTGSYGR